MLLRKRSQVNYNDGTVVDVDPDCGAHALPRGRDSVHEKESAHPVLSDEIEHSDSEDSDRSEKPEAISDDSSNLDDEVPVATKVHTGRLRRKKPRERRGEDDDATVAVRTRGKKAGPKDLLLKYLQPNVSNVADRPVHVSAGSDSDDVFDVAPPLLQAGRRKRKVVAHLRGNRVPVSSDDDGDDDRPFKKCPASSRAGSPTVRAASRSVRQSKVSYRDPSSSDEEQDQLSTVVLTSREQPEGGSEAQDEDLRDAEDKDFTDFDMFAFRKGKDVIRRRASEEQSSPSGVKCYSRLNRVQSKKEGDALPSSGKEKFSHAGVRRLRRLTKPANSKDDTSARGNGTQASEEVLPGQRRSLRECNVRNMKDASSSDEDGGDSDGPAVTRKVDAISLRRPLHLEEGSENEIPNCIEAEDETELPVVELKQNKLPTLLNVGVYGIDREDDNNPVHITKRIGRVEKILSMRKKSGDMAAIFCVKEYGKSYRDVVNVHESTLLKYCPQLMRNFLKRLSQLGREDGHCLDRSDSPAFDPLFTRIDRIIAHENQKKKNVYLVKWCRLPYSEVTWEKEDNLMRDRTAISRYHQINKKSPHMSISFGKSIQKVFRDGRALRDYQEAGVTWLDHNFENRTNCVLADEMGLGKTIQSVAMLETLRCKRNLRGPFLVVAPVSTLGHWQREIESLTDMNCVVYTGNQEDRDIIRHYEFYFDDNSKALKFNVLLTSFEMLMRDQNKFAKEAWQYIVVDEAHRLKSKDSKTTQSLRLLKVRKGGLLLLTGTPVQNNTKEIFSLLNLLDSEIFNSEEDFMDKYGEIKEAEQIKDLQENILRPRLLRRMKEDVEKSIPQKEETIVWVELTKDQRTFYKAVFENNVSSLLKGSSSSNLPNLRNVAMELRKVCNHPFLCNGYEDSLLAKHGRTDSDFNVSGNTLQSSSGKMVLVDKLLPKLKDAGRRVLIFSQFTIMLDLLEDYMAVKEYSYERIDGKIRGSERQAAIDRYSAKDSNIFVFLLSTRAGGLGITLTAADTCIIYDSDWNPQNDLQAMARCHRIGQTKDVKIYRLITRNTYEERLFECSSRKYGLDEAILGNRLGADVNLDHDKNIESLLKHGAYDIMKDENEEAAAEFTAQDIDQILEQRTQQRQIGGRGNNTFSVATFRTNPELEGAEEDSEQDSKDFWQGLMPEACERTMAEALAAEAPAAVHPGGLRKRTRGRVNYRENAQSLGDSSSDEMEEPTKTKKAGSEEDATFSSELDDSEVLGIQINYWTEKELKRLEDRLFALGRGRTGNFKVVMQNVNFIKYSDNAVKIDKVVESAEQIREEARLGHRSPEDIEEVSNALIELCQSYVDAQALLNPAAEHQTLNVAEPVVCPEPGRQLNLQPLVLPASVEKILESQLFKERIQRNAQRYLQQLHERKVLAEALQIRAFDFIDMPSRSKKLPSWWGPEEDADLLRGAHVHGHKDYKKIRIDSNLSFVNRTGKSLGPKECENAEQIEEGMPSDLVLGSRLKTLIEALPNGLTAQAVKKRAYRSEASRKSRVKSEQGKSDEAKKSALLLGDKNLAEWVTSSTITSWNAELIKNLPAENKDRPMTNKAKLKALARTTQKAPVVTGDCVDRSERSPTSSFENAPPKPVNECKPQPADFAKSPMKPLSHNNQRAVEPEKCDVLEKSPEFLVYNSKQNREKVPQENKAPKRRRLSLSQSAGKNLKENAGRQTSLKSFMKALPVK